MMKGDLAMNFKKRIFGCFVFFAIILYFPNFITESCLSAARSEASEKSEEGMTAKI